jgi:hypothetical protein
VPAQPVDATPPDINLFPKGGVNHAETMEAVLRPTGRCVEPLESWTVVTLHSHLRELVASKLLQDGSPEQISGWLKTEYPNDESLRVSHETIYRSLFIQTRGR